LSLINVKTAVPTESKFFVVPHMHMEGLWMLRITKSCIQNFAHDFCNIFKMRKQIFENPRTFLLLFYTVQGENAHRLSHN